MSQNQMLTDAIKGATTNKEEKKDKSYDNYKPKNNFDFEGAATSLSGQSKLNNYLYDSGLQNIFKDYQENIANLNRQEQESLQDAYFVREMSKKYLGEYASNNDIGDVSGDLLDVYGKYQQNKSEIKQNFDALSLNLDQEYRNQRMNLFQEKMQSQFDTELADFTEESREIMFNAVSGEYEGDYANEFDYIKDMREQNEMSQEDYEKAYGALVETKFDSIQANIQTNNIGDFETAEEYIESFDFLTDDHKSMLKATASQVGDQKKTTDVLLDIAKRDFPEGMSGLDYLEANRELLGEQAYIEQHELLYNEIREEAFDVRRNFDPATDRPKDYVQEQVEKGLGGKDVDDLRELVDQYAGIQEQAQIDTSIADPSSENYIGDDFPFEAEFPDANVGKNSYMYKDSNGNIHASVRESAGQEQNGFQASQSEIMEKFKEQYGEDATPQSGQEVQGVGAMPVQDGQTTDGDQELHRYVFQNNKWHRMATNDGISQVEMKKWSLDGDNSFLKEDKTTGDNFEYSDGSETRGKVWPFKLRILGRKDGPDEFEYNGTKYTQGDEVSAGEKEAVNKLFEDVHNGKDSTVVYYNQKFYVKDSRKIYEMNK